jgi:hypothetical protein
MAVTIAIAFAVACRKAPDVLAPRAASAIARVPAARVQPAPGDRHFAALHALEWTSRE